ncbi:MAG: hypothetical protein WDW36_004669 [Sanguina aurantia]
MILVACVGTPPSQTPRVTTMRTPVFSFHRAPPQVITPPVVSRVIAGDIWQQLRSRFAMTDCDADPAVLAWAHRYTRLPGQFEDQLRDAMPQLTYVEQIATQYDVAGEFVLLPWIESSFQSLPGRKNRPAGMWQIMPLTAGRMGLRVDSHYDARLDVDASANASGRDPEPALDPGVVPGADSVADPDESRISSRGRGNGGCSRGAGERELDALTCLGFLTVAAASR